MAAPKLRDPVVVRGLKYRIHHFTPGFAHLKQSFGGRVAEVEIDRLEYDKRAGLWRVRK